MIAWARAQPWCSGTAGMIGISWGGFNGLQVAALRPEGLKAVVTVCSSADRFADDIHTRGGCQLGENLGWATQMLAYSARPPDPEVVGDGWRETWRTRLEAQPFHLETWLSHQRRDAFWEHGSVCEDFSAIEAAVLTVGGWHDGYRNTPDKLMRGLSAPCKAILGPWNHKYPNIAGPEPRIGFLTECLRWWDRWLKGIDTGVERDPDMRLWLMDGLRPAALFPERPGRWIAAGAWPSARIATRTLHLTAAGLAEAPAPWGASVRSPADAGAGYGEFFPFAFGPELPVDQREDDAKSACADGPVLDAPLDIVGGPRVVLRLASDVPQAQVMVRLCEVFPDGASAHVTSGLLNLSHRRSSAAPAPMVPREVEEVTVQLDQIAYRAHPGSRLRIAVSTGSWPFAWPSPEAATLTLEAGRLELPVRPTAEGDEWTFPPPDGGPGWDHEVLRAPDCRKVREVDLGSGRCTIRMETDGGAVRDRAHGLETSSRTVETWTTHPDDPLCASADIRWEKEMARGSWGVRMEVETHLHATATAWVYAARLRTFEDGAPFVERTWEGTIPRDMV